MATPGLNFELADRWRRYMALLPELHGTRLESAKEVIRELEEAAAKLGFELKKKEKVE